MKKILFTLALTVIALAAWADDNVKTAYFTVEPPMACSNCEAKIKSNLRYETGVKSIDACAKKGIVEVKYDATKTTPENLVNAFAKIGYKATAATADAKCEKKCGGDAKCEKKCSGDAKCEKKCSGDAKCEKKCAKK